MFRLSARRGPAGERRVRRPLTHVRTGAGGAAFMPGLWGPAAGGGPGSIWKIDGATGAVSLFADVTLDGRPIPGRRSAASPTIAEIEFAVRRRSRDRPDPPLRPRTAARLAVYDHGVAGRPAQGLSPIAVDPPRRLDVTRPRIRQRAAGNLELCRAGASRVRPRRFAAAGSITRSPTAKKSGRSGSGPTARSPPTRDWSCGSARARERNLEDRLRRHRTDVPGGAAGGARRLRLRSADARGNRPRAALLARRREGRGGRMAAAAFRIRHRLPRVAAERQRRRGDRLPLRSLRRARSRRLRRIPVVDGRAAARDVGRGARRAAQRRRPGVGERSAGRASLEAPAAQRTPAAKLFRQLRQFVQRRRVAGPRGRHRHSPRLPARAPPPRSRQRSPTFVCPQGMAVALNGGCCPPALLSLAAGLCCPPRSGPDPATGLCVPVPTPGPTPRPVPHPTPPSTPPPSTPPPSTPPPSTPPSTPPPSTPPPLTAIPVTPSSSPSSPSSSAGPCPQGYVWLPGGADAPSRCCLQSQATPSGLCCGSGEAPGGPGDNECVVQCAPPMVVVGDQCC